MLVLKNDIFRNVNISLLIPNEVNITTKNKIASECELKMKQ